MSYPDIIALITFLTVTSLFMIAYSVMEEKYRQIKIEKILIGNEKRKNQVKKNIETKLWYKLVYYVGICTMPVKEKALSSLRKQLSYAGYRSQKAPVIFFGFRTGFALLMGFMAACVIIGKGTVTGNSALFFFIPAGAGYQMPAWVLRYKVKSRLRELFRELPDALDLLIICIDSGLGFDMAIGRISREFSKITPVLSKEFEQYFIEIKSGLPRKQVLTNLAERNGSAELKSVVTVLNQSARFGTDITDALRVYIASMRKERKQNAEEKGGKIAAKLTVPLVLLIMPALMIIILGPAIINLIERFKHGF